MKPIDLWYSFKITTTIKIRHWFRHVWIRVSQLPSGKIKKVCICGYTETVEAETYVHEDFRMTPKELVILWVGLPFWIMLYVICFKKDDQL